MLEVSLACFKFKNYLNECNQDFNWDAIYNNRSIVNDYADFIELSGQWLLHVDAHIIAKVFNITLEFYIKGANGVPMQYDVCNPNSSKGAIIPIYFNGTNHYERMVHHRNEKHFLEKSDVLDKMDNDKLKFEMVFDNESSAISQPTMDQTNKPFSSIFRSHGYHIFGFLTQKEKYILSQTSNFIIL